MSPLPQPVPHSVGVDRPSRTLPDGACDCHMHIFDPRFAPSSHWTRRPPVADVPAYRRLQERLGTSRTVVVTPSTYGTDNACTLEAIAQLGANSRGVAVVDENVDDGELDRLASLGVRGLRVNFVSPQSWGTTTTGMLVTLARKVRRLGWHVQVFAHPEQIVELAPVLASLPVPLVIDHLGRVDPAEGVASAAYVVIRTLLDDGNTWLKLSGVYMRSRSGPPAYEDARSLGRAYVRAAPERLLWGSDWPHTTEAKDTVDDADLVNVLRAWCDDDRVMDRVLVDNPARIYGFGIESQGPAEASRRPAGRVAR